MLQFDVSFLNAVASNSVVITVPHFLLSATRVMEFIQSALKLDDQIYLLLVLSQDSANVNNVFPCIVSAERSQYIRPKVRVHKGAETIQGRELFKGGNYMRKYGMYSE